jgi:hypothetical protein
MNRTLPRNILQEYHAPESVWTDFSYLYLFTITNYMFKRIRMHIIVLNLRAVHVSLQILNAICNLY